MKPIISYYGGKQSIIHRILPLIPKHDIYAEPFAGGATVFWAKELAGANALNDTNNSLVNFYVVLQRQRERLFELVRSSLHSRYLYQKALDIQKHKMKDPVDFENGGDVMRAWSWWILCNTGFANSIGSWGFTRKDDSIARKLQRKINTFNIAEVGERISRVQIDNVDAIRFINNWDTENTFFYVDPPYIDTVQKHYKGYLAGDYINLLEKLKTIKGRFMLSSFGNKYLSEYALDNSWNVVSFMRPVSAQKVKHNAKRLYKEEVIATNYIPLACAKTEPALLLN